MKGNFQARFWSSGGRGDSPTDCRKLSELTYSERGATMKQVAATLVSLISLLLPLCSPAVLAQQDFGDVAFVSSGPAAAQADFLHGLAQLHNFEYGDAAAHFRTAQQLAPDGGVPR